MFLFRLRAEYFQTSGEPSDEKKILKETPASERNQELMRRRSAARVSRTQLDLVQGVQQKTERPGGLGDPDQVRFHDPTVRKRQTWIHGKFKERTRTSGSTHVLMMSDLHFLKHPLLSVCFQPEPVPSRLIWVSDSGSEGFCHDVCQVIYLPVRKEANTFTRLREKREVLRT